MNGGKISSNTASGAGGGVFVLNPYSSFILNGGEISGNNVASIDNGVGGGIIIDNATFIMKKGKISDNTAKWGGGMYIRAYIAVTINGGEISGNRAYLYGGGVFVKDSSAVLKKEPPADNTTSGIIYGYINGDSKSNVVKDTGGTILSSHGHAVFVGSGTQKRETTVTETQSLDSTQDGAAGGWME
jgi:hypothetical protein